MALPAAPPPGIGDASSAMPFETADSHAWESRIPISLGTGKSVEFGVPSPNSARVTTAIPACDRLREFVVDDGSEPEYHRFMEVACSFVNSKRRVLDVDRAAYAMRFAPGFLRHGQRVGNPRATHATGC